MKVSIYKPKRGEKKSYPLFAATVKAGFPSPADDYMEQQLDLNEHLIQHPAATFFVRVDGDSMQGAHIQKGDILVVDRALQAVSGKIVVAVINGEFTVKRILIANGKLTLAAENPHYSPIEIDPSWDFQVWGVVTYVIHCLR